MKNFLRLSLASLLVALVFASGAAASGNPTLVFEEAWVRAMPPGMRMTAAFGLLRNPGDGEIVINGFSSPDFGDVSLHLSETVDGVSRMRELPELRIGPGESLRLEPGGLHLMLMMPAGERPADRPVTVRLRRDDGTVFEFALPVERR